MDISDYTPANSADFNISDPSSLAEFVDALFDSNLDYALAVKRLCPSLSRAAAHKRGKELREDERVTTAIGEYVKAISTSNPQRSALLLHKAWKLADNADTGAVKATALNILGKAHITERSERHTSGEVLVVDGLDKGLKRLGILEEDEPDEKETIQ